MVVVTWVVNYWRKIIIGLVAGGVFVSVIFLAPVVAQKVLFVVVGAVVMLELSWQAARRARRVSSWILVTVLAVVILLGLSGMVRLVESSQGSWYIFAIACSVAATDVAAQYIGQRYGKPGTFWPTLSPNKTLHGVLGGLVCGLVAASIAAAMIGGIAWLIFPLLPALAVAGDLLESAVKRSLNIKDFASYIPQTGGLLDRVDSWLPVLALAGWTLA